MPDRYFTLKAAAIAASIGFFGAGNVDAKPHREDPTLVQDFVDLDYLWERNDFAKTITMAQIAFSKDVQYAQLEAQSLDASKARVPVTPEYGIATPNEPIRNIVFVYGHSSFLSVRQPFAAIENLEVGQYIKVADLEDEDHYFKIKAFQLKAYEFVLENQDLSTAILQTTAVNENGKELLDMEKISKKIEGELPASDKHQALHVIAEEVDSRTIEFLTILETLNLYAEAD